METTAERIREGLLLRELKQSDLAERTGISKGALSSYISGRYVPKQTNIYKIAKALNVSEPWLMGEDVPIERQNNPASPVSDKMAWPKIIDYYDILNDIGKHEATKRVEELTFLPQYTSAPVKAARNDYINEEGELEKTQRDLSLLKRPD